MTANSDRKKSKQSATRISSEDFSSAEEFLKEAPFFAKPENQRQRQALKKLMPHLYVLKNSVGCSFTQLSDFLSKFGFTLQPATVRDYYYELLDECMDICQARMNEQISLMAEVKKETKGLEVASMTARVEAIMSKQRAQVEGRLDLTLGAVPPNSAKDEATFPPKKAGLRPATLPSRSAEKSSDRSGILKVGTASPPDAMVQAGNLRCQPLIAGVPALARRVNVPDDVYFEGDLEHPAVPGLLLSLNQRLSSVALEFVNLDSGEIRPETPFEKRFRVSWKKPIPITESSTSGDFTRMDPSLMK